MPIAKSWQLLTKSIWTKTQPDFSVTGTGMKPLGDQSNQSLGRIVISVDAMGGDRGPATVVAGISRSAKENPDIAFLLHGPKDELEKLVAKRPHLAGRCEIRDASDVVHMEDKPSHVMRHGQNTSMWSALDAVRNGEADAVLADSGYLAPIVAESNGELVFVGDQIQIGGGVALGMRKSDGALRAKLNAAIESVKSDGSLNKMIAKWFGADAPQF